jgi:hypothetical protein
MHPMLATIDFSHVLGAFHAVFAAITHTVSVMGVWPGTAD